MTTALGIASPSPIAMGAHPGRPPAARATAPGGQGKGVIPGPELLDPLAP